ncbi:permease-like cell division protein FtsX [Isoalcanivorax beigongshangi]|uniref:Cell division protein FtsX n=1 Tax=Isoalcanivorax beigongshangi TaxID=3238810 RepID=A0ABV4AFU8_9GAMM
MARNSRSAPAAKPRVGASVARSAWRDRLLAWRLHHRDSALDAVNRMRNQPISTLMTVLVIAIALALPTGISVLLENARAATAGWDGQAHLSVFLKKATNETAQRQLATKVGQRADVERVQVITPQQALDEYKTLSGFGDVLEALPDNPLPPVLLVFPKDTRPEALATLQTQIKALPEVDLVQLDVEWVKRLHAMIELAARIVTVLTLALALAVMLVVVNTIRLAIENRREEIVVVKIVGGTDGFVRRPFLYSGFCFGFAGGVLAVVLVQAALLWIGSPAEQLIELYDSEYNLLGVGWANLFMLPLFAGMLGLLGAWLAVSRHIQDVDPHLL